MKKICFMVATPFTANAFLLEHLKALSLRYQVSLCLNQSLYPLLPDFESSGIRIINVPIERKLSLLSDLKTLKSLLVVFNKEKFVSVHTLTPKAGLLGIFAAYLCVVPNRLHTFSGQVWANEYGFKRWFYKNIDRAIVFFSTQVFCDSASQGKFLQEEGVVKNNVISVIGGASISGVNLARFHPQADQKFDIHFSKLNSQDHFNFLFVGRIARDKGMYDLIEAFIGISQENLKARLWIVGPDEEGLRAQIEYKFPRLKGVLWMGPSTTPEVFMAKADVLVLPSYREGFGSVIIEAAACKTPAIAYRINGVIDAIEDGHSGILVNKGDSKALELVMKSVMLNPKSVTQMGEHAYQRAIRAFCAKEITSSWLDLYEAIVPATSGDGVKLGYLYLKRVFDVTFSAIALITLSPILLTIACIIVVLDGLPIIYWSDRVGANGEIFQMPKFRTMKPGTPALATDLLQSPEAHMTWLGPFLRKTSLDELPQLWSILIDDMSFVGPRPALFNQTKLIALRKDAQIDELKPGLTGLAQINGRDELSDELKVQSDEQYLKNISFNLDLKIIALTFIQVLFGKNVSH